MKAASQRHRRASTALALVACCVVLAGCPTQDRDIAEPTGNQIGRSTTAETPGASTADHVDPDAGTVGGDGNDPALPGVGNGGYDVTAYRLDLEVDLERRDLSAVAGIDLVPAADLEQFQLDLVGFELRGPVTIDGLPASVDRSGRELTITPTAALVAGRTTRVEVTYEGTPEPIDDGTGIEVGLFLRSWGGFVVAEPHGAAGWFPANDHPSDKAVFEISLTTEPGLLALAPGDLAGQRTLADGRVRRTWMSDEPMASYLAWILLGDLEVVEEAPVAGVQIRHVLPLGMPSLREDLAVTSSMLETFVDWFGPFPFDRYGVAVLPDDDLVPAMENQTLPVFARWVFSDSAPDRFDVRSQAHELAHQWFGDHVSPAQWGDIWLNEGLATWAEVRWVETHLADPPLTFERIADEAEYGPIIGLAADELFGRNVYRRGALTVEALRRRVGNERFTVLIRTWLQRHGGASAGTADFLSLVGEQLGADEVAEVADWLRSPAQPDLPPAID